MFRKPSGKEGSETRQRRCLANWKMHVPNNTDIRNTSTGHESGAKPIWHSLCLVSIRRWLEATGSGGDLPLLSSPLHALKSE
jgi:hypothetical protein